MVPTIEQVTAEHGLPKSIRVDQGPEFVSKGLDLWAYLNSVVLDFSRPGKPTDNRFVETFNGKVRAECVDQNWFLSLEDARVKYEAYRHECNNERPHSLIGNKSPVEFMKSIGASPITGEIPRQTVRFAGSTSRSAAADSPRTTC